MAEKLLHPHTTILQTRFAVCRAEVLDIGQEAILTFLTMIPFQASRSIIKTHVYLGWYAVISRNHWKTTLTCYVFPARTAHAQRGKNGDNLGKKYIRTLLSIRELFRSSTRNLQATTFPRYDGNIQIMIKARLDITPRATTTVRRLDGFPWIGVLYRASYSRRLYG